jgi:transcriptional regulator with XRE-family HTH domain
MPGERQTPTVRLRRLAAKLRSLRTSSGLTRDEIVERTGINVATLYRIEHARVRPQTRTLRTLLALYGVEGVHQDELIGLLRDARQRGWLHAYQSVLPEQYTTYIGFEGEARGVWNYESLWGIVDEAALRWQVGGREVMCGQLRHLLEAAELPQVTLQLIPFSAGAHAGMPGSFVFMQFAEPAIPDVVYIDSMAGELFLEEESDVRRYKLVFEHLRAVADSPDAARSLIAGLVAQM